MSEKFNTEQESFWAGEFGNDYSQRNIGNEWIAANTALFSEILANTHNVESVVEFGANIGLNLKALNTLLPRANLAAVEINDTAVKELDTWGRCTTYHESLLEFQPEKTWDMTLIKGVLIHINPDHLETVYDLLIKSSKRYICVAEYYNPTPVAIPYRGHDERLFKRDFAGEIMDRYPELTLIDYGFKYHRDNNFPQDDITWFLLEKSQ